MPQNSAAARQLIWHPVRNTDSGDYKSIQPHRHRSFARVGPDGGADVALTAQ
jgi:hypothetical protein